MPNPSGLPRSIRLCGFLQGTRNAGKFDALDARKGYPLLEKLGLNAAPQLPSHFVLARRRRSHLQPKRGSGSVKVLNAQDPRPSTKACDHAGSARNAAAAVSKALSVFSTGVSGASETSTNACDQSRLRLLTVRISPFAMVTSAPRASRRTVRRRVRCSTRPV